MKTARPRWSTGMPRWKKLLPVLAQGCQDGEKVKVLASTRRLLYRSDVASPGRRQTARPASRHDDRRDEFPPVIPWRVALQQSPPPLHRLVSILQHPSPVRKLTGTSNPPKKGDVLNVVSTIARKCLTRPAVS